MIHEQLKTLENTAYFEVPVTAAERILATAFPLSFGKKFMENAHETILSSCLCLFILLSLCVELLLGLIERTVTALEIGIR